MECPGVKLDDQPLEAFCYLDDTTGAAGIAVQCFSKKKVWMGYIEGVITFITQQRFVLKTKR